MIGRVWKVHHSPPQPAHFPLGGIPPGWEPLKYNKEVTVARMTALTLGVVNQSTESVRGGGGEAAQSVTAAVPGIVKGVGGGKLGVRHMTRCDWAIWGRV